MSLGKEVTDFENKVQETGRAPLANNGNTIGSPEGDGCLDTLFRSGCRRGTFMRPVPPVRTTNIMAISKCDEDEEGCSDWKARGAVGLCTYRDCGVVFD